MIPTPPPASACSKVCALYANVWETHTYSRCTCFPVGVCMCLRVCTRTCCRQYLTEFSSLNISKLSRPTGPLHSHIFTACEDVWVHSCRFNFLILTSSHSLHFFFFFSPLYGIELFSVSKKMNMSVNGNCHATTAIISEISNVLLRPRTSSHHHIIT